MPRRRDRRAAAAGPRGILLDFDHTLFDTDRFFWVDLKGAVARFGIPSDAWERAYEAVWRSGYSLEKHLDELARRGALADRETRTRIQTTFDASFSDLRPYLFADVPAFLRAARQHGFDLILLSFGDPAWQSYKVQAAGIASLFGKIIYTADEHGKAALVDELGSRYRVLHAVDNNPADLDAMKERDARVQTHLICRVEPGDGERADLTLRERFREAARYLDVVPRRRHHRCRSLDQVTLA